MRPAPLVLLALAAARGECPSIHLAPTSDYTFLLATADAAGTGYRWRVNGQSGEDSPLPQLFLMHADGDAASTAGAVPILQRGLRFVPGRWGSALTLDADGLLAFPRAGNIDLSEGTLEMWLALRAPASTYLGTDQLLFDYRAPAGDFITIGQNHDGILYAGGVSAGQWQSAWGAATMAGWEVNEWHHLAYTWSASASRMRLYLDGVLAADTNEGRYVPPAAAGDRFALAGALTGAASAYLVDEVRIQARELTAAEVRLSSRRTAPAAEVEIALPLAGRAAGDQIAFQLTTAAGACTSAIYTYPGIPIVEADPPSTLLPPGTTSFSLTVRTAAPAACRYSVNSELEFGAMKPFDSGDGATAHQAAVSGLAPETTTVNSVYVRCDSAPDYLLKLLYRSLPRANPPFPRTGNLWGWWLLEQPGLEHVARTDLLLGASFTPAQIRRLRALNPNILVLTSINAVENFNLPDSYYLKDTHGRKIEVWPGTYRLNLTKPEVAEYQARYAYQLMLDNELAYDGCFFDNFFTTESWLTSDIYGNAVQLDADEDGRPDDPAVLDAAWRRGVFAEMEAWRKLMPHAYASGHHFRPPEADVLRLFNGDSVGFMTANVLDGAQSFAGLWDTYDAWFRSGRTPVLMMAESSPPYQISYGYDYDPLSKIPASTLEFARTYFPYVRFGLAFSLMTDGYFAHEFGDTFHGNDWWYDELDFKLGYPLGPARRVVVGGADTTNRVANGGFEEPLAGTWDMWVNTDAGAAASVERDTSSAAEGAASALIRIASAGQRLDWHIDFHQYSRSLVKGTSYDLSFWAKADAARSIAVSASKQSPDWRSYGLYSRVALTTEWKRYVVTFDATETVDDARLQFLVGEAAGKVWLDAVALVEHPPEMLRRDFTNGIALLNPTRQARTITLGPGFARLRGDQAARHEYILDDAAAGFAAPGWSEVTYDSGTWKAAGPFYHNWGRACHQCDGACAPAQWDLSLREDDTYTIAAWWPAAPSASGWNRQARFELVAAGKVVASVSVDQSTAGDQWHTLFTAALKVADLPFVRVSSTGGVTIADALWVRSAARYNDGSAAAAVTLEPLDGIVLRRTGPAPAISPGGVVDAASFLPPIARGSWASLFGSNLSFSTRSWTAADFDGSQMPLALDGTRVEVNGVPSPVLYIRPDQVNFQVPTAVSAGPGSVRVVTPGGESDPVAAQIADASPALYLLADRKFAVALHLDGALVDGARPASPGESIMLWGSGFGATLPAVASGSLLAAPAPLADLSSLSIAIGGVPATVAYAGLTMAGLYQINVVVPAVPAGDQPLGITLAGQPAQPGLYLKVGAR